MYLRCLYPATRLTSFTDPQQHHEGRQVVDVLELLGYQEASLNPQWTKADIW